MTPNPNETSEWTHRRAVAERPHVDGPGTRPEAVPSRPARTTEDAVKPADLVDHVWSNVRVFLPGRRLAAACQLDGDRLEPHLAELADRVASIASDRTSRRSDDTAGDGSAAALGSFELVVVELGARTDALRIVDEARRLAGPTGSVIVTTADRRRTWRVGRSLAGTRATTYAALPNVRRPAVLIDRARPEAARYFLHHVAFPYRAPGRVGIRARLLQARNRAAISAPPRLAVAATAGRVTVVRGAEASPALLDQLVSFVRSSWRSLGLPDGPPDAFSPLVIGHRKTTTACVSIVLLGGAPPLVAKVPRYGGSNAALHREQRTLQQVYDAVADDLRPSLPRPLGVHEIDGTDVLLQSVVAGRHLVAETASRRLTPRMLRRQLELMLSWSARLAESSGRWVTVDDALIDATLGSLADAALEALDGDAAVEELLGRAIEDARSLRGTPIRLTVVHGDYWAGNVLVERGRVSGVVDWERAAVDGLPIWDPVKAVLDAAYHLDRYRTVPTRGRAGLPRWGDLGPWSGIADPRGGVGFRAAVAEPSWLSDLARDVLVESFRRQRIPLGWLPVAIPFHLVREFVHADVSARSVESWGSVLRALAVHPGTWADRYARDRTALRSEPFDRPDDPEGRGDRRGT